MTALTGQGAPTPLTRKRRAPRLLNPALALAGLVVIAVAWQLFSLALDTPVVPTFTTSLQQTFSLLGQSAFRADIGVSVVRILIGFAISAALGTTIGLGLGLWRGVADYCTAVLDFCRSVPAPLLVPIFIVALGLGNSLIVAVILTGATWPVLVNAFQAARGLDPVTMESARSCRIRGLRLFRQVVLPATLPQIFAGYRVALSTSIAVMVVAEILGASTGVGYFIQQAQQSFQIPATYAGVIVLGCIGWIADSIFLLAERWLLGWHHAMLTRGGRNG